MTAAWLKAIDRRDRVTIVPYQAPEGPGRYGLTVEACRQAAWAVTAAGERLRGAAAIEGALDAALGTSIFLSTYRLPGMRWFQDQVYRWVARVRHSLPGIRPYCSAHPEDCAGG